MLRNGAEEAQTAGKYALETGNGSLQPRRCVTWILRHYCLRSKR